MIYLVIVIIVIIIKAKNKHWKIITYELFYYTESKCPQHIYGEKMKEMIIKCHKLMLLVVRGRVLSIFTVLIHYFDIMSTISII